MSSLEVLTEALLPLFPGPTASHTSRRGKEATPGHGTRLTHTGPSGTGCPAVPCRVILAVGAHCGPIGRGVFYSWCSEVETPWGSSIPLISVSL